MVGAAATAAAPTPVEVAPSMLGGRVAVVTGAGTGLGRATTTALRRAGFRCHLVGRRAGPLAGAVAGIGGGEELLATSADISTEEGRRLVVERTLEAFGRIDVLVNNAGIAHRAPLLAQSETEWREVFATNVDAAFFLALAVIPSMRDQGYGRIVNISSVYGSLAMNGTLYGSMFPMTSDGPVRQPSYHASKGALINLTRDLAAAVACWGITVNCVSPGMFLTEQSEAVVDDLVIARLAEMTPVGRLGDPAEIGDAVAFLASERAGFITGVNLPVDGGWSLW